MTLKLIPASLAIAAGAVTLTSMWCRTAVASGEGKETPAAPAGQVQQTQLAVPVQPEQPPTSASPLPALPAPEAGPTPQSPLPSIGSNMQATAALPAERQAPATQAASSVIFGGEAQGRASSDLGDLLGKSPSALGVEVQRRNPIITDPRIRGYHVGQLLTTADGAFYVPARQDLDTLVSKIDSNLIRDVIIVKGPYSVRYGPGFSFLDIETLGSPRYRNGFEAHGSSSLQYKSNGDQWRGRQSFWGGDCDWGFRVGYDLAAGHDFRTGDDFRLPSSYNTQNIDFAFGFDLGQDAHFELRVLRQDQHDVEFPGQAFDINRSLTDAYAGRFTWENQDLFDRLTVEGWYNSTRFDGDSLRAGKQQQLSLFFSRGFVGVTDANVESPGYRAAMTWGQDKRPQLTVGTDLRYLSQRLREVDTLTGADVTQSIPRSHMTDPGVFADAVLPLGDRLTVKAGARADVASTNVDKVIRLPDTETLNQTLDSATLGRNFDLWSAYLSAEYKVTDHWTGLAGFGAALRPPTLTELYAAGPFLAVVQNGINGVTGDPNLKPEELRQFDLGLRAEYETVRFGVNGFYAWVHDYITFEERGKNAGVNAIRFTNTNRATLSGFELYGEHDLYDWLTPFATMDFVEGRDHTRDLRGTIVDANGSRADVTGTGRSFSKEEPLPGIPPYEARLGVRLHEAGKAPRWGVEALARLVASQHRVASSLLEEKTPGFAVFNVRSYWQVTPALLLTGGVENLGDKSYREHLDLRTNPNILQPGVSFYFGAQMTY